MLAKLSEINNYIELYQVRLGIEKHKQKKELLRDVLLNNLLYKSVEKKILNADEIYTKKQILHNEVMLLRKSKVSFNYFIDSSLNDLNEFNRILNVDTTELSERLQHESVSTNILLGITEEIITKIILIRLQQDPDLRNNKGYSHNNLYHFDMNPSDLQKHTLNNTMSKTSTLFGGNQNSKNQAFKISKCENTPLRYSNNSFNEKDIWGARTTVNLHQSSIAKVRELVKYIDRSMQLTRCTLEPRNG